MEPAPPTISVVIPVLNGAKYLEATIRALQASSRIPDQIVVVDDGSTDGSAEIATRAGVTVFHTSGCQGPATARGLGARESDGEILLFVDADVMVHADAIAIVESVLRDDPSVAAVFGSYDEHPPAPNFVSQWKNLSHHFFHQNGCENAQTFWAGCGAIRRSAFFDVGGFDLRYRGATIEDIALGYRLRQRGYRILLRHDLLCTHQKEWRLWNAWKTDLLYRGIPWVRLILRSGVMPNDLNVSGSQRLSTALSWALVALLGAASFSLPVPSIVGVGLFLVLLAHTIWMEPAAGPSCRRWLRPALVTAAGMACAMGLGLSLFAAAFLYGMLSAVYFRAKPPGRPQPFETATYALYLLLSLAALLADIPLNRIILTMAAASVVLIGLNQPYYSFFINKRGLAFTAAVLPLQFGYHFLNGISVIVGSLLALRESPRMMMRHIFQSAFRRQTP